MKVLQSTHYKVFEHHVLTRLVILFFIKTVFLDKPEKYKKEFFEITFYKTRTSVVHKKVSQGFKMLSFLESYSKIIF